MGDHLKRHHIALRAGTAVAAVTSLLALSACGARVGEETSAASESCVDVSGDSIKIGFINSLSGTMAISETTVNDVLHLAADEINEAGGVNGYELEVVEEDGASEPATFAERSQRLIAQECVAAVFGGWTSASRQAMLPVFEGNNSLLFYPTQYEGLEASDNIFYTGATTNQQIIPALDYLLEEEEVESLYLVGSDYVFPRTANMIIKQWADENDVEILGEDYTPLGSTDFTTIANQISRSGADAVFNTLNGDSNVAFFRQYNSLGLSAETMPVISVSIAEEEVDGIGASNLEGQLTSWNYYQTLDTPENEAFVEAFQEEYGASRVTSDVMQSAYNSLYLWKAMVEEADSFAVDDIRDVADGISFDAPEGTVTIDGETQHVTKTPRIGRINADGLIDTIWEGELTEPDPFLETYSWADEEEAEEFAEEAGEGDDADEGSDD
ncbi:urea ABC transporter substrate-binding protein [Citricoccus muralis]|uniref:Urea ABC transporter substrate-binding protein n=1 Tax=Citricoccus muralis TaxID=169134 RepID=A0ABY8H8T4_9MICC|nr:urea ABC transporter substrate-binding protein [Citricoccus muralis]WFP17068.1 urea ABC transporter substrate-binding protein [Citricoccus muralis]